MVAVVLLVKKCYQILLSRSIQNPVPSRSEIFRRERDGHLRDLIFKGIPAWWLLNFATCLVKLLRISTHKHPLMRQDSNK